MTERKVEALSERERACLAHLEEAKKLGVSFSQYCRDKQISMHQWTWIKRALMRKGVIGRRGQADKAKSAVFLPVRVAPPPRRRRRRRRRRCRCAGCGTPRGG
jgi:hypothetical protein